MARDGVLHKMTDEQWQQVIDVNLRGTFNCIRSAAPYMREVAKKELEGSNVNIAAVATYFPSGQSSLANRLEEVRQTVDMGADEIDMVISRHAFLAGEYQQVHDEVAATAEACGKAHLKVILETGELESFDAVRLASQICIDAGAHFIKTSTGKVQPAATIPVTLVMLETIRDHS